MNNRLVVFPVVLDSCVLFPALLRDTLLRAAEVGLYRVHWSQQILDDTTRNLIERGISMELVVKQFVGWVSCLNPTPGL